jgi:Na+/melibiose symporter-like transporter
VRRISSASTLAPFRVRHFRLQWPADLLVCWGFEMEALMLGWYVLVETQSVLLLTLFASLQYLGTLLAPIYGMIGDRVGHGRLLGGMRTLYAVLAATLMGLAFSGLLAPVHVFVIATLMSLVRCSDLAVRSSLIGETMPARLLVRAMGVARTTTDSARILGALSGAALVAALGMGPAYVVVVSLYVTSVVLVRASESSAHRRRVAAARVHAVSGSPWGDLRDGFGYVWSMPALLAAVVLAFLCNLTAYPIMNNLMPYAAKEIFGTDQRGLGLLVASCGVGSLCGSLLLSRIGGGLPQGRLILIFSLVWHALLLMFSQTENLAIGYVLLMLTGFSSSFTMVPLGTMLLRVGDPRYRGRVMGIRMFAIYALPLGLLASGPLITHFGYHAMGALYGSVGIAVTLWIGLYWREHLWRARAPANLVAVKR